MRPVRWADNLNTFMCRLSWYLGASTSWNPQGLLRAVMGLLFSCIMYSNLCWDSVMWVLHMYVSSKFPLIDSFTSECYNATAFLNFCKHWSDDGLLRPKLIIIIIIIIFPVSAAQCWLWPPRPRCFLITHNDAPQLVGLLWTSDRLVTETYTS
jgi:hypothetical protein